MKQSKLFPCYSIPMRDFFTSKGIRYELVGLHPKSHDMFWIYIKTNELEKQWMSGRRIIGDNSFLFGEVINVDFLKWKWGM